jgi:glyoxylate reductase
VARVLVTRPLTEGGTDPLMEAGHEIVLPREDGSALPPDELVSLAAEFDGIVSHLTDRIDTAVLESGRNGRLKVVANAAVGYDNIDVVSAIAMGITICNTPGVLDDTTADLAFLLILTATRLATDAERDLREGRWTGWGFGTHLARDVHGATLGLVGFGRIARAVAQRALGFDMEVLHTTRHDTGLPGFVPTLDDLLERSDIVSLHVPLTESTRHLIGAAELARMKTTAVLINTARGPVVDENALVDALEAGSIYAAGLDVFDGEPKLNPRLLTAPRTTLLPHIGSATIATRTRMAQLACQGVCDVLAGRRPPNVVVPAPQPA